MPGIRYNENIDPHQQVISLIIPIMCILNSHYNILDILSYLLIDLIVLTSIQS